MFTAALTVASLVLASTVSALSVPAVSKVTAPPAFTISGLTVLGTGCPAGTAEYVLSADKTAVTIIFSEFGASVGPGIAITENRKNCQIALGVNVPAGFTFGVANVDYRGYYQLDSKVNATQTATYYFQGQVTQATAHSSLIGPVDGADYTYQDTFDLVSTVISPCGVASVLNINSEVRVSNTANTKGFGYITDDSIDASLQETFNFQWQTCKK